MPKPGPADGPPVLLLHGWPYDIHSFAEVAPLLAARGLPGDRPVSARLRRDPLPLAPTRSATASRRRSAQDAVALMDALQDRAGDARRLRLGRAHGRHRRGALAGALRALVSVSGYLIGSQAAGQACRCRREAELQWWYQYLFRHRARPARLRAVPARVREADLAARLAADGHFDDATFDRIAAAFDNPDHVAIVIHNYRWRLGLADGEPRYDELERRLAAAPAIAVPTITLEGDANGAPHPPPGAYRRQVHRPLRAPHDRRRHRPQSAAGSAARLRPGGDRRRRDMTSHGG